MVGQTRSSPASGSQAVPTFTSKIKSTIVTFISTFADHGSAINITITYAGPTGDQDTIPDPSAIDLADASGLGHVYGTVCITKPHGGSHQMLLITASNLHKHSTVLKIFFSFLGVANNVECRQAALSTSTPNTNK